MRYAFLLLTCAIIWNGNSVSAADPIKVLIIDGQNNHNWRATTPVLNWIFTSSGRFTVTVSTTPGGAPKPPRAPKNDANPAEKMAFDIAKKKYEEEKAVILEKAAAEWKSWSPKFSDYDVVVSNYNGQSWPDETKSAFEEYVKNGGGFVSVHAANNAFSDWPAYNEMIGVGGWGGRTEKDGPMLRLKEGEWTRDETPGRGGSHGAQHEFVVVTRNAEHPIMKGLPEKWKHAADELYSNLRGPAKDITVLASALAEPGTKGTTEHEPMLMVINYGKGRVFHTTLGHSDASMACLGFQITLLRGSEWAATGNVTIPPPAADALSAESVKLNPPIK